MNHNQFHQDVIRHILNGIHLIRPKSIRFLQVVYQYSFYTSFTHCKQFTLQRYEDILNFANDSPRNINLESILFYSPSVRTRFGPAVMRAQIIISHRISLFLSSIIYMAYLTLIPTSSTTLHRAMTGSMPIVVFICTADFC